MIDSSAELLIALTKAKGGEVINVAPGDYGRLVINNIKKIPAVTITGPGARVASLKLDNSSGLTFKNMEFYAPEPGHFAYIVSKSENISFLNIRVHGVLDGNPQGKPSGISIRNSTNVRVSGSEFQQLRRAIAVNDSDQIDISLNNIHDIQTDGIMISAVEDIKIIKNRISNFSPNETDHPDGIQFLTRGKSRSSDGILIQNNVIFRGHGPSIQGIFLTDQEGNLPYKNVRIIGNTLVGTAYHGIAVVQAENVEISKNELYSYPGKTGLNWIIVRKAQGVTSIDNKAIRFIYDDVSGLKESGNKNNKPVKDAAVASSVVERALNN